MGDDKTFIYRITTSKTAIYVVEKKTIQICEKETLNRERTSQRFSRGIWKHLNYEG